MVTRSILCVIGLVFLAGANVDLRGDAGAEFPVVPWLAGGFLIIGAAAGFIRAWAPVHAIRPGKHSPD